MSQENPEEFTRFERAMLDGIAALPPVAPDATLVARFRARRAPGRARLPRWPWALAAGVALVMGAGWYLDRVHRDRADDRLRSQLVTALSDLSDAKRLFAITMTSTRNAGDTVLVRALTRALLADPSVNVRVAAAEALGRVATSAELTRAVSQALRSEASPYVQSAVLAVTNRLDAGTRAAILAPLLARQDLDPLVRQAATERRRNPDSGGSE